jgi:RimJ/RimL family protein N-acetyltransferase
VLDLGGGKTLTVRPVQQMDVDGLMALFESLSDDDRFRRFFSGFRPRREWVESWTRQAEHGGCGVVAIVSDGEGERLVGEAGYTAVVAGRAELAVTVAREWRGWLGPYLVDVLVGEAAARGIRALEAEVLIENRPMNALLRRRGAVTIDRPDWTVARVMIGTGGDPPPWPAVEGRPRILVEGAHGRWRGDVAAREAQMAVVGCPGPTERRGGCPALEGRPCPLADHADVIVVALPPSDERSAELVAAHAALHPHVPVVTETEDLVACSAGAELVRRLRELAAG